MKIYKFLRPLYIEGIDFAINDEVFIMKISDDKYWLTFNNVDIYLTDKQYNEFIKKQIIELV